MAGDDEEVKVRLSGDTSNLDAAISQSRKSILALGNDLAAGGGDAKTKLDEATVSMVGLSDAMNEAESISDAQRTKIDALAESYGTLAVQAGTAGDAQEDVSEKIGSTNLSVASLTKSLVNMENPAVKIAGKALAIGEAFKFGWNEGEKLRQTLNDLTNGGFDVAVQSLLKFDKSAEDWISTTLTSAETAKQFENELNILRNKGIDPAGMSMDEVRAKVEELGKALQASATEQVAIADKIVASHEKVKVSSTALADHEIAERKRVTEALEKEEQKRIDALTKKVDDAAAAEAKGNATEKTTKATEKATDASEDYDASLADLTDTLEDNAKSIFNVGKATGSSNAAQSEAASRAAARRDAEADLNAALLARSQRESEAEIATAIANTTYSDTVVVLDQVQESTEEVFTVTGQLAQAVGKAEAGQRRITNTYEETNVEIGRSVDGFTLLSNAQGKAATETGQLAELNEKYGEKQKDANDTVVSGTGKFNAMADAMGRCVTIGGELKAVLGEIANS